MTTNVGHINAHVVGTSAVSIQWEVIGVWRPLVPKDTASMDTPVQVRYSRRVKKHG